MRTRENSLVSIIMTGLFAAIIYLGVWVLRIPVPALVGRPFIHFGNTLTAVAILYLGCRNGMLAGIIGFILGIIAGVTKIFTTYCVSIVEALMVGTSLNVALVSSFVSLPATVINSISTAICTPILYFAVRDGARRVLRKSV